MAAAAAAPTAEAEAEAPAEAADAAEEEAPTEEDAMPEGDGGADEASMPEAPAEPAAIADEAAPESAERSADDLERQRTALSAGEVDDNERWDEYVHYRNLYAGPPVHDVDVTERYRRHRYRPRGPPRPQRPDPRLQRRDRALRGAHLRQRPDAVLPPAPSTGARAPSPSP